MVYEDLKQLKRIEENRRYAKDVVEDINKSLKAGYIPFEADQVSDSMITMLKRRSCLKKTQISYPFIYTR